MRTPKPFKPWKCAGAHPKLNDAEAAKIRARHAAGESLKAIAAATGLGVRTVKRYANRTHKHAYREGAANE